MNEKGTDGRKEGGGMDGWSARGGALSYPPLSPHSPHSPPRSSICSSSGDALVQSFIHPSILALGVGGFLLRDRHWDHGFQRRFLRSAHEIRVHFYKCCIAGAARESSGLGALRDSRNSHYCDPPSAIPCFVIFPHFCWDSLWSGEERLRIADSAACFSSRVDFWVRLG